MMARATASGETSRCASSSSSRSDGSSDVPPELSNNPSSDGVSTGGGAKRDGPGPAPPSREALCALGAWPARAFSTASFAALSGTPKLSERPRIGGARSAATFCTAGLGGGRGAGLCSPPRMIARATAAGETSCTPSPSSSPVPSASGSIPPECIHATSSASVCTSTYAPPSFTMRTRVPACSCPSAGCPCCGPVR